MSSSPLFPSPPFDGGNTEASRAWQNFFDSLLFGLLFIDDSGQILNANAAAYEIFALQPSSPPSDIARVLLSGDDTNYRKNLERFQHGERFFDRYVDNFTLENGDGRCVRCTFSVLHKQEGGQNLALVTLMDASEEKAALEQCELSEQRYRALFDAAADAMMVISPQGILLDLNKMTCEHVNMKREELEGKHIRTIFTSARQHLVTAKLKEILERGEQRTFETLLASPDSPIPVEINARLIDYQGQPAILGIARDITDRKILQARLEYQASTDPLTALNNRRHFLLKADQEFLRFKRYGNPFTMLMLDLDYFKKVNDTFGHQTGDALLREFARQMRVAFRHSDVLGRIGGEEFSVLLLESSLHRGIEIAERLRQLVEKTPLQLSSATVTYTVSIGVTMASESDASLDVTMRRADAALYRAKRNGRNQVEFEKAPDNPESAANEKRAKEKQTADDK